MAAKAVNFKMEELEIKEIRQVADVFKKSLSQFFKEGAREYAEKLKQDPFYKLTVNIQEASKEESEEILSAIESLSDDDLEIAASEEVSYG